MKAKPQPKKQIIELNELRNRLREAEETLSAIRSGEVDALIVSGPGGDHIFSLRGAEQPYRVFVEQMHQGALTLDSDGMILFCNRRFAEMIRTPLERVIGSHFNACVREEDWSGVERLISGVEESRAASRMVIRAQDGTLVPVSISVSTLPLDEMQAICMVVTDLTEQEELLAAEQANEAKDHFLAALSHELRTPLTPVLMTVAALEQDERMPDDLRESLLMLRRNVELEARLIDDLLDLTRIVRNKVDLKMSTVDLDECLRCVLAICAPDLQSKKLKFSTDLQAKKTRLTGDPARIQQILWNVIRNAIKFTPPGGEVTIATHSSKDGIEIRVVDSGIGIDDEAMSRIFRPFEQASRDITRQFGGLGLGLAISRKLVELHGGSLTAQSGGVGLGSSFVVKLPFGLAKDAGFLSPANPVSPPANPNGELLKILLVEDHPDTATLLARLLRRFGYDVRIANSRESALNLAASEPFDVMLSDIGLPDGTGHELMRQIRKHYSFPGIALTGYGMEEDVSKSREAGFFEHVVKPVNIEHLKTVLSRATHR